MISDELLEMIRCPLSGSKLQRADDLLIKQLRELISSNRIRNRAGDRVTRPADGGLVDADRTVLYLVYDEIPDMIADEAIPLDQLETTAETTETRDG